MKELTIGELYEELRKLINEDSTNANATVGFCTYQPKEIFIAQFPDFLFIRSQAAGELRLVDFRGC